MSLGGYIKSKIFLVNFGIAVIVFFLLFWLTSYFIDIYTSHNQEIKVPKLINLKPQEAQKILDEFSLTLEVVDSVYLTNFKKGVIVEQTPDTGNLIKENRKIFVTINALTKEKIKMPDLVGSSIRQAITDAETYGLRIGKKRYVPDFAMNYVLRQFLNGKEIKPGTIIPKNSYIDLEIGKGLNNGESTTTPNLLGISLQHANNKAKSAFLSISGIYYDKTVITKNDTMEAVVIKQNPKPNNNIVMGSFIDVWLSKDKTLIMEIENDTTDLLYNNEDEETDL